MDSSTKQKPVLPTGEYHVRITQITKGKSESKGTPFITCKFENQRGFIDHRLYVTPKGLIYLSKLFEAVGLPVPALENAETASAALLKKELLIDVVETLSSYNNKQYKEVKLFKPLPPKEPSKPVAIQPKKSKLPPPYVPAIQQYNVNLIHKKDVLESIDKVKKNNSLSPEDKKESLSHLTEWLDSLEQPYNDDSHNADEVSYERYGRAHGLDDDTIDDAFDGNPEWYWNIE